VTDIHVMLLQDEGGAAADQQEAKQPEQPETDAEFQYMHEDEGYAAGHTQVQDC
jgi:hypothetical protein